MGIIVRIVSRDGKMAVMKALPGLPSRLKVPAGASVEVTEDGVTRTLAQYVNKHADSKNAAREKITVETVDSWQESEGWLDSMANLAHSEAAHGSETSSGNWFTSEHDTQGNGVLGTGISTLAVGGVVAAGAGLGIYEHVRSKPKDTVAPSTPTTLRLAAEDDTGVSSTDGITSKTSELTFTGKAEAGSTVELFEGETSLGTVVVGTDGSFSKDLSLAEGTHSITASARDRAGNTSAKTAAITVTVDATIPGAPAGLDLAADDDTGASNTDNITTKTSGLTITGTGEAGQTVELFDGTTSLGTATIDASGKWTKDISLANGQHAVTAKVSDKAGNVSGASEGLNITVDTSLIPAAPTGLDLAADDDTGPSDSDNLTSKTSGLTISGSAQANTVVELFDGTTSLGTVSVRADGTFSKDVSLNGTGAHTVTAKATDAFGVSSDLSTGLTITIAPAPSAPNSLDLASEDDDGASNVDNVTSKTSGLTISGNADAGSTVDLFDGTTKLGTVTAGSDGKWTLDVSLAIGQHAVTAQATNSAGYSGPASGQLDITIVAPASASSAVGNDDYAAAMNDANYSALSQGANYDSSSAFG